MSQRPTVGTPLIFHDLYLNDGNGYDALTGYFTVPFDGIYFITATAGNQLKLHAN